MSSWRGSDTQLLYALFIAGVEKGDCRRSLGKASGYV